MPERLSKILLPVDFSERSAGAAHCVRVLSTQFPSEVILLHVLTPPPYEFGAMDIGGSMMAELYRNRSEQAARDIESFENSELPGLRVRRVVLEGDPAPAIVKFAREEAVGIIIMPTHGFGPFRRFILGSNTAKVLHDADCPVWTGVHMEQAQPRNCGTVNRVLCAVDLGPQSSKTLCWAGLLAGSFGARLTLMHVVEGPPDANAGSWQAQMREAADAELDRLRESANVECEKLVESGDPAAAICAAVARSQADVLAIGRGSAAGVYGRLRTSAYAIIRQSPCPVVSV